VHLQQREDLRRGFRLRSGHRAAVVLLVRIPGTRFSILALGVNLAPKGEVPLFAPLFF
jgi:hypothetical protein